MAVAALIFTFKRFRPGWPGMLIAAAAAALAATLLHLPAETIGGRFVPAQPTARRLARGDLATMRPRGWRRFPARPVHGRAFVAAKIE